MRLLEDGPLANCPIGMIVLSPVGKVSYQNTVAYDHSSFLRTMQNLFGVSPYLGAAATATDLKDLFVRY